MRRARLPIVLLLPFAATLASCGQPALLRVAAQVCDGQPVDGAAEYTGASLHPISIVDATTDGGPALVRAPTAWSPSGPDQLQLVACIESARRDPIERCEYTGSDITRYRRSVTVRLVEARSGANVAATNLSGEDPRPCYFQEDARTVAIEGGEVDLDLVAQVKALSFADPDQPTLAVWLQPYVEGPAQDVIPGSGRSQEATCGIVTSVFENAPGSMTLLVRLDGTNIEAYVFREPPLDVGEGDHIEVTRAGYQYLYKGLCP